MKQVHLQKTLLIFLTLWLGMTFAVDFVAIPQAFRNIPDSEIAGNLGIKVFSIFNKAEIFIGLFVLILSFLVKFKKPTLKKVLIIMAVILLGLSITYTTYLSPGIERVLPLMHSSEPEQAIAMYEAQHDFYHRLYLRLDSLKIILLMISMGFMFIKGEEE